MIGFVTRLPFIIVYRYEKRWPNDKANHTCEELHFLASADIKPFGHAYLFAMLLLIGPALFTSQVFLFSISYRSIYADATLKLSFEKLKPTTFLKLSVQNDTLI